MITEKIGIVFKEGLSKKLKREAQNANVPREKQSNRKRTGDH